MDVRQHVKIKKIPGGAPKDSEFVDGAVITKNVAHKAMSRSQRNPRVMFVTFPLESHRVEDQYTHLEWVAQQEKEFLHNLAARIATLRPHIVLVEKPISRIALDAFAKLNICVACTVKESAIQFVACMTQGDILRSIDRLIMEPHLGRCAYLQIQTFDHQLIPGRRKTYMRFEGCNKEMGCTILLRGGDNDTLTRIKRVTRFLVFIVRHLKLETCLWRDSLIGLPQLAAETVPPAPSPDTPDPVATGLHPSQWPSSDPELIHDLPLSMIGAPDPPQIDDEDLPDDEARRRALTLKIQQSLNPYVGAIISISPALRFQPPHPIKRMKELDDALTAVKRVWEDEITRGEKVGRSVPNGYFNTGAISTLSREVKPTVLEEAIPCALKTVENIRLESHITQLKGQHEAQRRVWEWYLHNNMDDFIVEKYQRIVLWECTMPIVDHECRRACTPLQLKYITFYGENDSTLGQFIHSSITDAILQSLDPKTTCSAKSCDEPTARHCEVFVHNEATLMVTVDQWDRVHGGSHQPFSLDLVTTWGSCRLCGMVTPVIPVSEETQRYSFAKYLEHHFYPADIQLVQGAGCKHNPYEHHIRHFSNRGMIVRFQTDPVNVFEIVYPPCRIIVNPEARLELKNLDFTELHARNALWYTALVGDLKLVGIDAAKGGEEVDSKLVTDINALIHRAEMEKGEITRMINQVYRETGPTDTLGLNQALAYRQDKIAAWQQDFDHLPKVRPTQTVSRKSSASGSVQTGPCPLFLHHPHQTSRNQRWMMLHQDC